MIVHLADERVRTVEVRQVRVEPGLIVLDLPRQQVARVLIFGLDQEGPIAGRLEHGIDLGRFINGPDLERRLEDLGLAGLDVMAKELVQPRPRDRAIGLANPANDAVRPWLDPATLSGRGGSSSTAYRKRHGQRICPSSDFRPSSESDLGSRPVTSPPSRRDQPRGSLDVPVVERRAQVDGRIDIDRLNLVRRVVNSHDRHQRCRIS